MTDIIDIQGLTKIYGLWRKKFTALDDITLTIRTGMFGLLGPNGAGKTTMMKILATLLKPTAGTVSIYGYDLLKHRKEIRSFLGYLPQEFGVYPSLYTYEFLDYIARLNGLKKRKQRREAVEKTLTITNLQDLRDRRIKTLSGGMIRRLGIAQALIGSPQLLIVDEPTSGLDPEERIRFRNLLTEISSSVTIILSTHIVNDISSSCSNLALLHLGKIVYWGNPSKLLENARGKSWILRIKSDDLHRLKENVSIISMVMQPTYVEVHAIAESIDGFEAVSVEPTLEDAYIYYMEEITGMKLHEYEDLYNA